MIAGWEKDKLKCIIYQNFMRKFIKSSLKTYFGFLTGF